MSIDTYKDCKKEDFHVHYPQRITQHKLPELAAEQGVEQRPQFYALCAELILQREAAR